MRTLIQKIHVEEHNSFACREYRTPNFETTWHQHEECELIVIKEGKGTALIGDFIGEYIEGDVFFLASNLPHWFRKSNEIKTGSAIVVHFRKDFWGSSFLALPEMKKIQRLLEGPKNGISLRNKLQRSIAGKICLIEQSKEINRIQLLIECLDQISCSRQYKIITKYFDTNSESKENSIIEKIFSFSFKHYLEPITLSDAAKEVEMSIPTFCRFFKRNIKKTYFDFIKEIRISHACKLLRESDESILEICYQSGYNSWAHFSKQFKNVKLMTPNQYRKQFNLNPGR